MKIRQSVKVLGGLIERGELTQKYCSTFALGYIAALSVVYSLDTVARMREIALRYYHPILTLDKNLASMLAKL